MYPSHANDVGLLFPPTCGKDEILKISRMLPRLFDHVAMWFHQFKEISVELILILCLAAPIIRVS